MSKQITSQPEKRKIHLYNDNEWSAFGLIYDLFFFAIITLSITSLFFEYELIEDNIGYIKPFVVALDKYDYIFTVIFAFDLLVRFGVYSYNFYVGPKSTIKEYCNFFTKKDTIFSVLAIIPIFLKLPVWRIFRILKYFTLDGLIYFFKKVPFVGDIILGFSFLIGAFKKEFKQLLTVTIIFLIIIFAFSLVIFNISLQQEGAFIVSDGENMESIGDAFWFTFVTITTIGYGDIVPVSPAARIISMILSLVGIGFLAIYTAVVVDGFARYYKETKDSKILANKKKPKTKTKTASKSKSKEEIWLEFINRKE